MISVDDLQTLPYSPDLTQAGITYVCRLLSQGGIEGYPPGYPYMRGLVTEVVVELAFRRYLAEKDVPYELLEKTSFVSSDMPVVALGGRRVRTFGCLISRREDIRLMSQEPGALLDALAVISKSELDSTSSSDRDLYIFGYLFGLVAWKDEDLSNALEADQPIYLAYPLPGGWARPTHWASLGELSLKSDTSDEVEIHLGGLDASRSFISEQVHIVPRQRLCAQRNFFSLGYLHITSPPDGLIGVHSPLLEETILVHPREWGNLWIYGMRIVLVGYIRQGEFRQQAHRIPAGRRVVGSVCTEADCLGMPVRDLNPIPDLFVRVRNWEKQQDGKRKLKP